MTENIGDELDEIGFDELMTGLDAHVCIEAFEELHGQGPYLYMSKKKAEDDPELTIGELIWYPIYYYILGGWYYHRKLRVFREGWEAAARTNQILHEGL